MEIKTLDCDDEYRLTVKATGDKVLNSENGKSRGIYGSLWSGFGLTARQTTREVVDRARPAMGVASARGDDVVVVTVAGRGGGGYAGQTTNQAQPKLW